MIKYIYVDGFKSLRSFSLDMEPGLNILIGPNGSGKTNIITFFEFISNLHQYEVHEAVGRLGGVGSIFAKIGQNKYFDTSIATIFGYRKTSDDRYLTYLITYSLKFTAKSGFIIYNYQHIKAVVTSFPLNRDDAFNDKIKWDLDISATYNEKNEHQLEIKRLDRRKIKPRFSKTANLDLLTESLNYFLAANTGRSLLYFLTMEFETIRDIIKDIVGGLSFNIIPSKVKIPEDVAKQPGIKPDGTGLASTLYAIKRNFLNKHYSPFSMYRRPLRESPKIYSQIVEFAKLANDSILDLHVDNNAFDNQLVIKVHIKGANDEILVLPLSAMSDGTIKWITLITAILSTRNVFSIEEPENFLHPWMQSEIVKILRENVENDEMDKFALMSTHSETILNNCDPSEIVLITMEDGITVAKRMDNQEIMRKEISESGFGLGYYYMTGLLE